MGNPIKKIQLLQSPLEIVRSADEKMTKTLLDMIKSKSITPNAISIGSPFGTRVMLTGLALVGKATLYLLKQDFSIHHHEVLIEF